MQTIEQNVARVLGELPAGVQLVAAAKDRPLAEIMAVVGAGVATIGENYVQEAERVYAVIGHKVKWHLIGHLQKNKVKKAVAIFDMIETVDSVEIAVEIDKRCGEIGKIMPVLIEVNSGREKQKAGVLPEELEPVVRAISSLAHIRVMGLMTMGPRSGQPEDARPYFVATKNIFDKIKQSNLPDVEMRYLSMGMTNSYRIAVEEGANIVRLGDRLFGPRKIDKGED